MAAVKLYWEDADGQVKLYQGDARYLSAIPDESVDMIATSPPYWGKRWYGEETVTVWGGDPNCQHVWGDEILERQRGTAPGKGAQCGNTLAEVAPTVARQGAFCQKCNAWLGTLGLEPTFDCGEHGQELLELRPGLSEDEMKYILSELIKLGLL